MQIDTSTGGRYLRPLPIPGPLHTTLDLFLCTAVVCDLPPASANFDAIGQS